MTLIMQLNEFLCKLESGKEKDVPNCAGDWQISRLKYAPYMRFHQPGKHRPQTLGGDKCVELVLFGFIFFRLFQHRDRQRHFFIIADNIDIDNGTRTDFCNLIHGFHG